MTIMFSHFMRSAVQQRLPHKKQHHRFLEKQRTKTNSTEQIAQNKQHRKFTNTNDEERKTCKVSRSGLPNGFIFYFGRDRLKYERPPPQFPRTAQVLLDCYRQENIFQFSLKAKNIRKPLRRSFMQRYLSATLHPKIMHARRIAIGWV